jgi:Mn-dependent DtxR family transcriptional regulator
MNEYLHTVIAALSIYFAWKIGRVANKNSLITQIAGDTLNRLEKEGMVKYIVKDGEKIYQRVI